MDRSNPYEAAFEAYLKHHGLCYVGVDEARRSLLAGNPIKNLDFIVLGMSGARLLVDIKGRRFPGGPVGKERFVWENWATQDDIDGIGQWMDLFGDGYLGLFAFFYHLQPTVQIPDDTPDLFTWRDDRYLIRAVAIEEYRRHMCVRSPKWNTVGLPQKKFQQLARPFRYFTHEIVPEEGIPHESDSDRPGPESTQRALQTLLTTRPGAASWRS